MATTTNYGWTTPDDTDLVKDGAAAIRTLGSSVDTTTKALNPSTTEGDIEYRSATANTNSRLALGNAGEVLTVNSGEDAPEWAALPVLPSGLNLISTTTIGSAVASVTVTGAFSSTYDNYLISYNLDTLASFASIRLALGSNTSYRGNIIFMADGSSNVNGDTFNPATTIFLGYGTTDGGGGQAFLFNPNKSKKTVVLGGNTSFVAPGGANNKVIALAFYDDATTAHTEFTLSAGANMTGGTIRVYGYKNS